MQQDRNLLFGVLAVQLGKVSSGRLMQAAAAWAVDPSTPLDACLVEQGVLSQQDRDLIERLVAEAIRAHAGDAKATLNTFGGAEQAVKTFGGSIAMTDGGVVPAGPPGDATVAIAPAPDTGVLEAPDRYKLVSEQGRGGYGRVLLVHDRFMARDVALKELIPPSTEPIGSNVPTPSRESMEAVSRFLQEARITGQLEHPSIVPVYELGHRENGALYYTMKLVRGQTLSKELAKRNSLRDRLELLPRYLDLCHAIAYAHDRGVIHRDIKPDNVMIGSFGETVVIDWGLAKLKGRADVYAAELRATAQALKDGPAAPAAQTLYGTILGTPHFMAPEQARGDIDSVDERSDVYALGAVLYVLLTGKRPYDSAPLQNVILHMNLPPLAPVAKLAPNAPPELITVCNKALQTKQEDRYRNAGEIASDVRQFMSGALVQSHEYTFRDQLRRFIRKNRAQVLTAGVACVTLLAVGIISYVQVLQANANERKQRVAAEGAKKTAIEKGEQEAEARAIAEKELYVSNIRLAYRSMQQNQFDVARNLLASCPVKYRNWEWGWLIQGCNRDLATLRGHTSAVTKVAVSPNGTRAVSGDSNGNIVLWDLVTGAKLRHAEAMKGPIYALRFSPGGKQIVAAGSAKEVTALSGETLEPEFSLAGHFAAVNDVAYSPDGRFLASASSDDTVRIWNMETHETTAVLSEHLNDVVAIAWSPDGSFVVSGSLDNAIVLYDTKTWTVRHRLQGHTNDVTCVAVAPDSSIVVSGGADGQICVWSAAGGTKRASRSFSTTLRSIAFAPEGGRLVATFDSPIARLFSVGDLSAEPYPLRGHSGAVTSAAFLASGDLLVTASADTTLKLWHAPMELHGPPPLPAGAAVQEVHLADGAFRQFALASSMGACRVFDSEKGKPEAEIDDLGTTGLGMRLFGFSPKGDYMMFTGEDNRPKILDFAAHLRTELKLKGAPYYPAFANTRKAVAIASTSGEIELYDATSGDLLKAFSAAQPGTHNLPLFSPDDSRLMVTAMDKAESDVMMFDSESGQQLWRATYPAGVTDTAFDTGGKLAYVSGGAGLRVYDAARGDDLSSQYTFPKLELGAMAIAPDSSRIIAALQAPEFIVLDGATGRELLRMDRDTPFAPAAPLDHDGLFFSSDGRNVYWVTADRQGLATWGVLSSFNWADGSIKGDASQPLERQIDAYKARERANRLVADARRDAATLWLSDAARAISAHVTLPAASRETDPFADATTKEFDIKPDQWTALLQMGRNRLKQLRDVHGYRGAKGSSDLVLDKTLAGFLSIIGFETNDIIVRINDSSTPGYDMFIEALEMARRKNENKIACYFFREGKPMIHIYYRTGPSAPPAEK